MSHHMLHMLQAIRNNLKAARFDRNEIAGSLGDMGTFLPLLVAMATTNGLDFAAGVFFSGFFNVVTGVLFAVPMAVQPMKAIAAIAITEGLSVPQILAAGIGVSAIVLILGLTGLVGWLNRQIPQSVVRGVQLGLGLSLLIKGFQMISGTKQLMGLDSYSVGILAVFLVLMASKFKKIPSALILFAAGILIAIIGNPSGIEQIGLHLTFPHLVRINWDDFVIAFPKAVIPQIPLTVLNSVVAVCALSSDLFPTKKPTPKAVAVSVGTMNLIAAWFGGMPMCHGAGGMYGQHRFGARTNGSILFLGVIKIIIAILFGASLMSLCRVFPMSILGAMLIFSGIGLSLICRDQTDHKDAFVMLLTAGTNLALNNMALAFVIGWIAALGIRARFFTPE